MADFWPRGTTKPEPGDMVQVLMTEEMARRFEQRCLGPHTVGSTELAGPLLFGPDDLPTYIIGITDAEAARERERLKPRGAERADGMCGYSIVSPDHQAMMCQQPAYCKWEGCRLKRHPGTDCATHEGAKTGARDTGHDPPRDEWACKFCDRRVWTANPDGPQHEDWPA